MKIPKIIEMFPPIPQIQPIKLRVRITGIRLSDEEQDIFDKYLHQYVQTLLEELFIPGKINLFVKWAENHPSEKISYKILIQAKPCKVPPISDDDAYLNGKALSSIIAGIILLNRAYLVNAPIINTVHSLLPNESDLKNTPSLEFQEMITEMVNRGFSLHKLLEVSPKRINQIQNRYLLEYLFKEVEFTRVKVRYNTQYFDITNPEKMHNLFLLMQEGLFYELGFIVPKVEWEVDKELLENEFVIKINDISHPISFGLKPSEILVNESQDRLKLLNMGGRPTKNPANGQEVTVVDKIFSKECEKSGLTYWDPTGYLILFLSHQLSNHAGRLLTADLVENHINELRKGFPDLIDIFMEQYDLFRFTQILRDLLEEGLSIRDMRTIMENLILINGTSPIYPNKVVLYPEGTHFIQTEGKKIGDLKSHKFSDFVRKTALQAYISNKFTQGTNTLTVFLVDSQIEEIIRNLNGKNPTHALYHQLMTVVNQLMFKPGTANLHPVIITSVDVRHDLKKIVEKELPQIPVLSYDELLPHLIIQPLGRISFSE